MGFTGIYTTVIKALTIKLLQQIGYFLCYLKIVHPCSGFLPNYLPQPPVSFVITNIKPLRRLKHDELTGNVDLFRFYKKDCVGNEFFCRFYANILLNKKNPLSSGLLAIRKRQSCKILVAIKVEKAVKVQCSAIQKVIGTYISELRTSCLYCIILYHKHLIYSPDPLMRFINSDGLVFCSCLNAVQKYE